MSISKPNAVANTENRQGVRDDNTANLAHGSSRAQMSPYTTGPLYNGLVLRAGAGTYDVVVRAANGLEIPCCICTSTVGYLNGVSNCAIPVEGTRVLYHKPYLNVNIGVILGVMPATDFIRNTDGEKPPTFTMQSWELEPTVTAETEQIYADVAADPTNFSKLNSPAGRPNDVLPGHQVWINEAGVGIGIFKLMTAVRATERAKIECFVLDDTVRLVAGYFRQQLSTGEQQVYNDGGMLQDEQYASLYQFEHYGQEEYGQRLTKESGASKGEILKRAEQSTLDLVKPDLAPKKRIQCFSGQLGDIVNVFVAKPDPEQKPETASADSKDQGLYHQHIDSSGRLTIKSAAGISFQRCDRIPVPKKQREAWDPEGDKVEQLPNLLQEKKPVEFEAAHPYGRALQLRDGMAWRDRMAVQRLHERSKSDGKKDFYLPEEKDLKVPDDEYDKFGRATEDFKKNDGARASINLEPDGSIIIRDAWGSEIILAGGNITLNAASHVFVRAGKSIVQLAGHDIVQKARKSVDITARDRDVRIKANVNLHMVSEGRSGQDAPAGGGVLIESLATSDQQDYSQPGEQTVSRGIVLRATKSRVLADAKIVHLTAGQQIVGETFDRETGKNDGQIKWVTKFMDLNATDGIVAGVGKDTGLVLLKSSATLGAKSANLAGGTSVSVTKGTKVWIPYRVEEANSTVYQNLQTTATDRDTELQTDAWLAPMTPTERRKIKFTYRSSDEYGTVQATEITLGTKFYVYEPSWALLARFGARATPVKVEEWQEFDIEDTYSWPGKEAYDGQAYVRMTEEVNIGDPTVGTPKARKELKSKPGSLELKSFHQYEVAKP